MTGATIARLSDGGRIWALGAAMGDDKALEALGRTLLARWQRPDKLVVLGNMLGASGDSARTLDLMLRLRRRVMAVNVACDALFLRGAQEEMWHKLLALQFAMTPLDVLDWMLARGLAATIAAYGGDIGEGRTACRLGPSAIARWTTGLRKLQAMRPGHADLLNALLRAAISPDGRLLLSAAGVDASRPVDDQADAFWWNRQNDRALADKLARGAGAGWQGIRRLVRGTGAATGENDDDGLVLTVSRDRPALVALDGEGALIERIEV
jgi:serine/threonine protein phosphatase 1